ncbi:hypothetical protein SAMN02745975_03127 [Geosporobacter subterraneus DSM 17957]|uniref:Uncharacterized protein n=1 Tax=Geosporobacter subterraneus DSM 17957 TaxID=1121919 RepID=A0A1M6MXD0_9FIRM|nr:hypothetical protein [Geosporobacter subterraneus]SHJ88109.1 hypothetical protein SAMN02745975_03127 [Geosporobacter subterraneus DSM 17957]
MNWVLLFLPASVSVLVLYVLNRIFNYKIKLIHLLGSNHYKGILLTTMLIIAYTSIIKYDIDPFRNPMGISLFWSYLYLVSVQEIDGTN